ncbi:MAG: cyclopropane fatty acyl phospholipid synthase [Gammaproteobacteria bacterium]|nr:MAG: cyclopropane fatty acyl phospholipid synthase [Gammaproteobacteria bacterium]
MDKAEKAVRDILALAELGVDGEQPWDLRVTSKDFYRRLLGQGSIALGETYMDGLWECEQIDVFIYKVLRAGLEHKISVLGLVWPVIWSKLANLQSRRRAFDIGKHHYDIGNELYKCMLDARMTYTCGYWKVADNLADAQEAKLDLVCRKLGLVAGMRVLDIGCGWGSFARFAAENYGVKVVGVTVSKEQIKYGRELCADLDVDLKYQDYREVEGRFDRVVSLGMFEHVGAKNYKTYMQTVERCLEDDGLFLLHTIGTNTPDLQADPWTIKYIFPGGYLPLAKQIAAASQGIFIMEDWHNFGVDYDPTLMAWVANIKAARGRLEELGYNERFYRMWTYWLLAAAGSARARRNQLWQIVYSKKGLEGGYLPVR